MTGPHGATEALPPTNAQLQRLRADAWAAGNSAEAGAIETELERRRLRHHTGEMLDIYDDSLRPLGAKERGLAHLDGDWHRTFHCWLVSPARRTLIAQRRSLSKETYPGALDVSVAGHYRAGEGLAEVCREGQEELGLALPPSALVPLGRAVDTSRRGVLIDREVADVFLYATDAEVADLRLDPAEVAAVLEVPLALALAIFRGTAADAVVREMDAAGRGRTVTIRGDEFTPHHDRYYARLALQALRIADGLPPLEI